MLQESPSLSLLPFARQDSAREKTCPQSGTQPVWSALPAWTSAHSAMARFTCRKVVPVVREHELNSLVLRNAKQHIRCSSSPAMTLMNEHKTCWIPKRTCRPQHKNPHNKPDPMLNQAASCTPQTGYSAKVQCLLAPGSGLSLLEH